MNQTVETIIEFETHSLPSAPVSLFPPLVQRYINDTATETQTTLDANCMAALSIFSASLANKFYIESPWEEQCNLFTCVVAGSGERKSTTFKRYTFPIIELERDSFLRGEKVKRITNDSTLERLPGLMKENNETIAVISDEGGILETAAGRYGNMPNLDIVLQGFDGGFVSIDRANKEPLVLLRPSLTIGLFVQPTIIHNLPERFVERGLFGRFLYSFPKPLRGTRDSDSPKIDPRMTILYKELIHRLVHFTPSKKIPLILDDEALAKFRDFARKFETRLGSKGDLSDESISSWTNRFPGQLLRIASLLHVAEQAESSDISEDTINRSIPVTIMERVIEASKYFIEHAKVAFGSAKSDKTLEDAKYILEVFEKENLTVMSRQHIWTATKHRFAKAENLDQALTILEDRDYISTQVFQKHARGRKGQYIILNKLEDEKLDQNQDKPTPSGSLDDIASVAQSSVDSAFREVKTNTGRG